MALERAHAISIADFEPGVVQMLEHKSAANFHQALLDAADSLHAVPDCDGVHALTTQLR
jgi:hypothetical protein